MHRGSPTEKATHPDEVDQEVHDGFRHGVLNISSHDEKVGFDEVL
jgi:hypothetical protein